MRKIIQKILDKTSNPNLLDQLDLLSDSELNTLLLEVFRNRSLQLAAPQLRSSYTTNRFVPPSDLDPIALIETELEWLKLAKSLQFKPLVLSPLAPLGTSSAIAKVDQNNVVSALRGTEVVSDATNVLALHMCNDYVNKLNKHPDRHYVAVHRHVRAQGFDNPKFSAHFSTFCLASGGLDKGNFAFELTQLDRHLALIYDILHRYFPADDLSLTFFVKKDGDQLLKKLQQHNNAIWSGKAYSLKDDRENEYYQLLQFKVYVHKDGQSIDIADGGFVDWTQQLLSNKKHRCFISGIGIELLHRI